ncbi:DEAD/DEAH box helicase family protein [Haloferax volcanii]|uniref:DEAD/DEAH box helicase family protein n=1 Tax=Haloferax volcanii TaxID=2246 RepID=UPI00385342F0
MTLQDHDWEGYYAGHRDHVHELFLPALKHSIRYDRVTGSFSSSILSVFAEGLESFVNRGGRIRMMAGVELFEADQKAIERGETGDILVDAINWDAVREGFSEEVLEALAWLIDEGHLKIKIGAMLDSEGRVRGREWGEWHQKMAIFTDEEQESISLIGSPNSSFKALYRNRESLDINRSWVTNPTEEWDEQRKVENHREEFQELWTDNAIDAIVFEFPDAVEKEILEYRPTMEPDWDAVIKSLEEELIEKDKSDDEDEISPRPYQAEAIKRFKTNGNRILLKHATGVGKTWSSLFAVSDIATSNSVVIILAPTTDLVEQWDQEDDNVRMFFPQSKVVRCSGDNQNWRKELYRSLVTARNEPLFAVSTMHPSTMGDMFNIVAEHTKPDDRILIADEVHNVGSERRRNVIKDFDAGGGRIGLSATPERGDEGDDFIWSYFGPTVDEITLEEAIHKHKVLSEYKYYIHVVTLRPWERDKYNELSEEITQLYVRHREYDDQPIMETADQNERLKGKIMERANIVKEAEEKDVVVTDVIDDAGEKTMVFGNKRKHSRRIKDAIDEVSTRRIGLFFGSFSAKDREGFLTDFRRGTIDTLVSIDCLTEGVDVPECDSAVLVANSLSEREAVQRRGRVLRKTEDSDRAVIHDFVTLPVSRNDLESGDADLSRYEIRMIEKELNRVERMNEEAYNHERNDLTVIRLRNTLAMYK